MASLATDRFEVEMKFPVSDLAGLEKQLVALGGSYEGTFSQIDHYFSHPARDFAVTDEAFRLRCVGDENVLTYKGPKLGQIAKSRQEIEVPVGPGVENARRVESLIQALGFGSVACVRKRRRILKVTWCGHPLEAALDEVHLVGNYLELEVVVRGDQIEAAQQIVLDLSHRLGLADHERRSYLELLLEIRSSGGREE